MMRHLNKTEIEQLTVRQRCWAEDWNSIIVAEDFQVSSLRNSNFYGHVQIGSGATVTDVKMMKGTIRQGNKPNVISVLNEGGDGNVVLCPQLTAQLAWLMINYKPVFELCLRTEANSQMTGMIIGDYAKIEGVSKIVDSVIQSSKDSPTYIGVDVIMENSVTACGAEVTDAAKVYECFVGEAVHIGKAFSAEASLFFANAYMDNGEACAAVCGPFACSHHKSTLLIGGEFSFYNAGSNTNQSNHAYKMGPIHWGTLQRGAKTASGCHILWPATIGAFSMVMGKVIQHPNLEKLPFSYVFGDGDKTYVYPGTNIKTVGTWRDVNKWPTRDKRKSKTGSQESVGDLITFDFPNPYILQYVAEGKTLLESLLITPANENGEYIYEGCHIKKKAVEKGVKYYEMILDLVSYENETCMAVQPQTPKTEYVDMFGFIAKRGTVEKLVEKVSKGEITDVIQIHAEIATLSVAVMTIDKNGKAYQQWLQLIEHDARKEFSMGDVSEDQLRDFISKLQWNTSAHLLHKN